MRLLLVTILVFFTCATTAWGARNITLPHSEDFTDSDSIDDIVWATTAHGASVTRVQGSWRGSTNYVARIDPPTSTGGGENGEYAALGAFHFSSTNTLNVAFALNVGTTFSSSAANAGGGLDNKFVDIFLGGSRAGLLGLNNRFECGAHEFSLVDSNTMVHWHKGATVAEQYPGSCYGVYAGDGTGGTADIGGEWVWLNYAVNHTTGDVILRVWDREGNYSGTHFQISDGAAIAMTEIKTIGGYYNQYHPTADTNSRLLIDDITISSDTSSIDPPAGFITSGDPVNGACGTNHNATLASLTSANANNCATGTVASFSGTGPWTWNCAGSNGGTTASCSASLLAVGGGTGRAPYSATARVPYSATKFARYYEEVSP